MKTIDELVYYCNEPEPIGAIMLEGEWGCGKTYLIEHDLRKRLVEGFVIIRVSLFGMANVDQIHSEIKYLWLREYSKEKIGEKKTDVAHKTKELLSGMSFLPEVIREVAATDWVSFLEVSNTINEKRVILVFDDLERCKINIVELLGVINDYCENKKIHVIIVANQEKIKSINASQIIKGKIELVDEQNKQSVIEKKGSVTVAIPKDNYNYITYDEIKEKIIKRTVKYLPNYSQIIENVINTFKYQDDEYKDFVIKNESDLIDLFAPYREKAFDKSEEKRTHNIRSLKCAIADFYRVYKMLEKNNVTDIEVWFKSFVTCVLSYRAGIIDWEEIEVPFPTGLFGKLYPEFENGYILPAEKTWIRFGVWNEELMQKEIEDIISRRNADDPFEVVKGNSLLYIDEDVVKIGMSGVINAAYLGKLELDDYVQLIINSYQLRYCDYQLKESIKWDEVKKGVNICIQKMLEDDSLVDLCENVLDDNSKNIFTKDEWETYEIISNFRNSNKLVLWHNRDIYIKKTRNSFMTCFIYLNNKQFYSFDEEMAVVTADSFDKASNEDKCNGIYWFKSMWEKLIISSDIDIKDSLVGFKKLSELLLDLKLNYDNNGRVIAKKHAELFMQTIEQLIKICIQKDTE